MILTLKSLFPGLLVLAASAVAWLLAPVPIPSESGPVAAEAWTIPPIQRRDPPKWNAVFIKHDLWGGGSDAGGLVSGGAANAATAAATRATWRLMGVVIDGSDVFALIGVGDQPSKPYRVGDLTPDGGKILRIEEDRLHLLSQGAERVLEVYRK